jgi:hypothetical protein
MLKRAKDMKDMLNAAPGMVAQAQQLSAQAQQMASAQQMAAAQQRLQGGGWGTAGAVGAVGAAGTTGADFEPIAGVALDQFTAVSKGVAAYGYDAARLPEIAASKGIDAFSWDQAYRGWNDRIKANPAVAQRFNQLYRGI